MDKENITELASDNFVHLHVHTEYSLLDGASRVPELIATAKKLGMKSIAITDHGNMYGVVNFYKEAKKAGIKPVIGCEVYLAPRSRFDRFEINHVRYYHLILLAENETGYRNIVKLVSLANKDGMYYKPRIDKELLREYHQGIICLSACIAGEIPRAIILDNMKLAEQLIEEYIDIFGKDNFYLEIQSHGLAEEKKANEGLILLARKYNIGLVATNDIHYVHKADYDFHDVLLCIQTGKTIDTPGRMRFQTNEFYLKSQQEMEALFPELPEAITNTAIIAERCNVEFTFGNHILPKFPLPQGLTDEMYLRQLCEERIGNRYKEITAEITNRLNYELGIIHRMGFDSYFLIVWDFINYAREHNVPVGPGRGSAAGSIVAYVLGITDIDPLKYDLLFERFLNPERVTMPDIDVDFCYMNRGKVIEYVKHRYGEDHVAQIITFGTMAAKASVKDVGRALGMPYAEVDRIAKMIPAELGITLNKVLQHKESELAKVYEQDNNARRLLDYAIALEGLPRNSSTHAAGIVIAREPLTHYMPVQVSDDGTLITQYDKDLVEELGLLKMDFLGLRTLTVIGDAINNIKQNKNIDFDVHDIPDRDELTSKMLCNGDTGAVFQMESSGMTQLVKDLAPQSFEDLIPTVALYRPGPLGSGMVQDFINGRHGKRKAKYLHPLLEPILKETFGVILYQEQVMQIVQILAGFSLGQADLLRRAMGHKEPELLMKQKNGFIEGARKNNIDEALANQIFELMVHFANYGFNKSHSAAYGLVAWQTAYLKAHYPAEFMAAMLTSVMDKNDKVSVYIEQCKRMEIKILPPDINASNANFSVDGDAVRFGLAAVRNVGEAAIANLAEVRREKGFFKSLLDFCTKIDMRTINKRAVESLIKCGAFDSLGAKRAQLLAILPKVVDVALKEQKDSLSGQLGLFGDDVIEESSDVPLPDLEEEPKNVLIAWEKEITGFYITGHPLDRYAEKVKNFLPLKRILQGELREGQLVRVFGLICSEKRLNTKKGDTMCFATLEDYTHRIECVVFPNTFYDYNHLLVTDMAVVMQGKVNLVDEGAKILVDKIWSLEDYMPEYFITIGAEYATKENMDALREIFNKYHGEHVVYLYYKDQNRRVRTEPQYWLNQSPHIMEEIEKIFGEDSVKQR